jgi:PAS domain S-box-containing protein
MELDTDSSQLSSSKDDDLKENQDANTAGRGTLIEQAEARTDQANLRTDQANTRTEEANTRTNLANTRTEEANTRTEQAENREQGIRASELSYRRLFETAKDGILILDAGTGMIVDVNPFLEELLGYSHAALLGKKVWELGSLKDLFTNQVKFEELQQTEYVRYENLPLETAQGRRIEVEFVSNVYLVNHQRVIQCCIRDISERKRLEQALHESNLELQRKNTELERFLYTASHDLKSPVVTVRTFLGFLEQDIAAGDAGRMAKDINFIRGAADKMAQLLDDLLEISRIGRISSLPVQVMFHDLVADARAAVAGRIAERGVKVQVEDRNLLLFGDRVRLAEVLQNLLDNACKFMGDQKAPHIEVSFEVRGAETVFFVRDNGIGVDPRHQAKVFGLFEKLDAQAEGTGIGLSLAKRIVEMYGGRIWVESSGVGRGACFYFTLPGAVDQTNKEEKL